MSLPNPEGCAFHPRRSGTQAKHRIRAGKRADEKHMHLSEDENDNSEHLRTPLDMFKLSRQASKSLWDGLPALSRQLASYPETPPRWEYPPPLSAHRSLAPDRSAALTCKRSCRRGVRARAVVPIRAAVRTCAARPFAHHRPCAEQLLREVCSCARHSATLVRTRSGAFPRKFSGCTPHLAKVGPTSVDTPDRTIPSQLWRVSGQLRPRPPRIRRNPGQRRSKPLGIRPRLLQMRWELACLRPTSPGFDKNSGEFDRV